MRTNNRKILITGLPGCRKTTLCNRVIDSIKGVCKVGGILSTEIREGGSRKGFKIADILAEEEGILAHINQKTGPGVRKYRVNLNDLDKVGVNAISDAVENCDVVVIDEIGPMELCSNRFIEIVNDAFDSDKCIIATIHFRSKHPVVENLKRREGVAIYRLDENNRDEMLNMIVELLI
jgi:nucleoside-triphosphatase